MRRARDLGYAADDLLRYAADDLLRATHNRALPDGKRLWDAVGAETPLGEIRFQLPAGKGRKARTVRQALHVKRLRLSDRRGGELEVTGVIARELDPPGGVKPIVWRLLSNRRVANAEQAAELIDWYRARWDIELLFLVLKQSCRVEALQLGHIERLEKALALFLIVAWRVARLMRLGRTLPELEAKLLFSPEEWEAAYILNKQRPPKQPPTLNTVIRLIAKLGGFLARKRDGEPGMKTLWLGLQRVRDFVQGMAFVQGLDPGAQTYV